MAEVKLLEYTFLVDAIGSFTTLSEFEKFFNDFLDSRGLSGEIVSPMAGSKDHRVMYITKKEVVYEPAPAPVGRPITIKGQLKRLTDRKLRKPAEEFKERKLR